MLILTFLEGTNYKEEKKSPVSKFNQNGENLVATVQVF